MTINNITNASKIMLGSQEIEKLYIGSTVLYLKNSSTPSESFFCKLELTDGTIVDLEGSGELTKEMVATPYASTLYKIHVGNLCTSIGDSAVLGCKQLVEVIVDESVTTIDGSAFNQDNKVKVIDLPSTLTSIGNYCFHNMGSDICNIIFRGLTPPTININNNNKFITGTANIYVPDLSLSVYQTAWSDLATKIKALSTIYDYYDAEIEYLESTGTQWIDTLIHPVTGYGFELYGGFTVFQNGEFFGGGNNYGNGLGICTHGGTGSYGIIVGATEVCTIPAINNVMHQFRVNTDGTVYVDNEYKGVSSTAFPEGTYTMNIFRHSATQVPLQEKIYYCKIFNSESLVFDGIPVRKNGIGYMFDKVSKLLFSNQGTGSFTLGPDKLPSEYTELEYLETSGTQWIDTGITSTSTMVSQIKFNLLSTSSSSHVYGYRKANDYESYRLFFNGSTGLMYDGPGTSSSNKRRITMNNSVSKDTVWEFELGNNYVKNLVTGNNIGSSNSKYLDGVSTITLSYWEGNGSNSDVSSARWYYVKIYEDSTLILDLIPVRKDGVGYMFDRVSKTLFTNQGTGSFILGPDKS